MAKKARAKRVARKRASKGAQKNDASCGALEQGLEDFSDEISRLGEKFGEHMEKEGKHAGDIMRDTFGVVGPLLSSAACLICVALLAFVLALVNIPVGSGLIDNIHNFLLANIGWFFLIFLFFSYASYLSKKACCAYRFVSPLVTAAGITVALWAVASAVDMANMPLGVEVLSSLSSFLSRSLFLFFIIFSVLGYLIAAAGIALGRNWGSCCKGKAEKPQEKHLRQPVPGRLYRSGKERILGGVCGGIAEHMGIDPTIVRLLWVAASLLWGLGIILYIVCWVIIPRNPKDKWN
jgi:phage shock protein C